MLLESIELRHWRKTGKISLVLVVWAPVLSLATSFRFTTVKPGAMDGQAPHINVILFMRGSLLHLYTRIYFDDEKSNEKDPLLNLVPPERRHTLIAKRTARSGQHGVQV